MARYTYMYMCLVKSLVVHIKFKVMEKGRSWTALNSPCVLEFCSSLTTTLLMCCNHQATEQCGRNRPDCKQMNLSSLDTRVTEGA